MMRKKTQALLEIAYTPTVAIFVLTIMWLIEPEWDTYLKKRNSDMLTRSSSWDMLAFYLAGVGCFGG
jgi:hypothetical protein